MQSVISRTMRSFRAAVWPLVIAASVLLVLSSISEAAKKRRSSDLLEAKGNTPAEQLQPYIQQIDQLLALHRPAELASGFDQAQGRLALLRQSFAAQQANAERAQRGQFTAAIQTCDRLSSALDERKKTLAEIKASTAVKGSDDLGERRKDTLTDGVEGRRKARAARVELKRERREAAEARREAIERDDAMTARSVQRWNERAIQLRKQVLDAYGRISAS